jgi:hypothetical protein
MQMKKAGGAAAHIGAGLSYHERDDLFMLKTRSSVHVGFGCLL